MIKNQNGRGVRNSNCRPVAMVGSGDLTASVSEFCGAGHESNFYFNVYRTDSKTGEVSHWLSPRDINSLAKLSCALASTLAEEQRLDDGLTDELNELSTRLFDALEQPFLNCRSWKITQREISAIVAVIKYLRTEIIRDGKGKLQTDSITLDVEILEFWLKTIRNQGDEPEHESQ